jgi:hypothetical protein
MAFVSDMYSRGQYKDTMPLSYTAWPLLTKNKSLKTLIPGGCPFTNTFEVSSWAEFSSQWKTGHIKSQGCQVSRQGLPLPH